MKPEITFLPRDKYQGYILPISYVSSEYYDVTVTKLEKGFLFQIEKKPLDYQFHYHPETMNYPDRLYLDYLDDAKAYGIIINDELIGAIETAVETWTNRLRITELWVKEEYRRKGYGKALIEVAKARTIEENYRALVLETQSSNTNAIDFYLSQGFTLIGLDTCSYHNEDIKRKHVRLDFGWFPESKN